MEDLEGNQVYVGNQAEKRLLSRGIYPYDNHGYIVSGLEEMSDIERRDYSFQEYGVYSEPRINLEKTTRKSNSKASKPNSRAPLYVNFLSHVEQFDIPIESLERDTMIGLLVSYFPGKFGNYGRQNLVAKDYSSEAIRKIFSRIVDYSKKQREKLTAF